jgi:acetylornithine deacetylase/succinyl-diaminopimelate desuccinylase family protein
MGGVIMEELTRYITKKKTIELLSELVTTPSISKQEERLAGLINKKCLDIGLESMIDRHGNVIAHRKGNKEGIVLALNSHLDTVDVGDKWTMDPFSAEIIDDKMYGLGACDCKGSMAAIILALEAIQNSGLEISGELYFTAVVQEEVQDENAKGTVKLIKDGFKADMAIIGEPTELGICIGCEGMVEVEVTTEGVPVHASVAEKGVNAIKQMMHVIQEVEKIQPDYHPLLGKGSISPGVISGGLRSSVVPDKCTLKIGRFIVPGESGPGFLKEVEEILERLKKEDSTFSGTARLTYDSNAGVVNEDQPVVDILKKAYNRAMKGHANIMGTRAHLDSDFLINLAGIPSVAFGPGSLKLAHEADEYVDIGEVVKAAKVYAYAIAYALQAV